MDFLAKSLATYAEAYSEPEPDLLHELVRVTHLKTTQPRMLSGHLQGRFLSLLAHLIQPKIVFEVGTFTGYATLCMAEGLAPEGRIITCDLDEEALSIAGEFFALSSYSEVIDSRLGDARVVLQQINEEIDLAFIDGDKLQYLDYYQAIHRQLHTGGLIVADNVLWSGKVVDNSFADPETEALRSFNTFVRNDPRVVPLLLPIRDGLMLLRKVA